MNDKAGRKELLAQYKQHQPEAGVYRIVNTRTGRALLASATNLASVRNRLEFGKSTKTPSALDHRLTNDAREFGIAAFELEVLEVVQPEPETTAAELREELATLEQLWREKLDPAMLY
jgi:hypothetical protein